MTDNDYSWFQRSFQGRSIEKEKEDEDSSDQETKEKEKERENEKVILLKMKAIGLKRNGKDMRMRTGMKAFGPMKMRQHGNLRLGCMARRL